MITKQKILLYINTIVYLKPIQIIGQLTKRFKLKSAYKEKAIKDIKCNIRKVNLFISELDGNESYLDRFNVSQILENEISLLNEKHKLNLSDWKIDASPLWRFNLHYFEYCIPLGVQYKQTGDLQYYQKFKSFIDSWIKTCDVNHPDAFHPYTISMRIPVWLICADLFETQLNNDLIFKERLYESIYLQYRTLQKRQETWQLGNHYFENLKTIVLCSLLFNEEKIYSIYIKKFMAEIKEEILDDGFHFELSPMYHRIVLEDLIRVCYVLQQIKVVKVVKVNETQKCWEYVKIKDYIQLMADAMHSLEKGTGRIPLFNDSGEGIAKPKVSLLDTMKVLFGIEAHEVILSNAGYYKLYAPLCAPLYASNITVVFDAGLIGPTYMTGHGHCDCLSFEMFYKGEPIFVNSGTYQYQGEYRKYFRSTQAHNTVVINEHEQSEIWGEHRVGRRISGVCVKSENNEITSEVLGEITDEDEVVDDEIFGDEVVGEYVNYLGEKHKRILKLTKNKLSIIDEVTGAGKVKSYLHLAPKLKYVNGEIQGSKLKLKVLPINTSMSIEESVYSYAFGKRESNCCLVFSWTINNNSDNNSDNKSEETHGYCIQFTEGNL